MFKKLLPQTEDGRQLVAIFAIVVGIGTAVSCGRAVIDRTVNPY